MNHSSSSVNGRYCVVIPAFNAAKTVGTLVQDVKRQGFNVVVIDDGSEDQTAMIAAKQGVTVISHLHNLGKGMALRTGFRYALRMAYDGVVTMDSDGQHDPAEICRFILSGEREHAGMVLGNRMATSNTMPQLRRWTNHLMSRIVSALTHQSIPDSQCGFRLIRKEVLASVTLRSTHFEIETELLLAASRYRWKMISVPIRTIYQQHSSYIEPIPDFWRFMQVVLRHLCSRRAQRLAKVQ